MLSPVLVLMEKLVWYRNKYKNNVNQQWGNTQNNNSQTEPTSQSHNYTHQHLEWGRENKENYIK